MDLASYAMNMSPEQRQAAMAEILRQKTRGENQDKLAGSYKESRRFDNIAAAGPLMNNPEVAAAAKMMATNAQGLAPKQLGQQGFMLPNSGAFIPSPIYEDEKQESRDLRRDLTRQQTEARAAEGSDRRALQETLARLRDDTSRDLAKDRNSVLLQIAAMRRDAAAERAAATAAGKADKAGKGKILPAGEARRLAEKEGVAASFRDVAGKWDDKFAGDGSDFVAGIQNELGAKQPLGFGEKWAGKSNWWKEYNDWKNVKRHDLFGSALTATEKSAFDAANITEGMAASQIRANLKRQQQAVARAYNKLKGGYGKAGYAMDDFEDFPEEDGPPATPPPKAPPARVKYDANGNKLP